MVNDVTPAASKLLEQIRRLSAPTAQKEGSSLDFKKDVMNALTNTVQNTPGDLPSRPIEKVQKKSEMFVQTAKNISQENTARNVQMVEVSGTSNVEKKMRREPLGSLLDTYV